MKREARWTIIIAVGVCFGLLLWTVGGTVVESWRKGRKEEEWRVKEERSKARVAEIEKSVQAEYAGNHIWVDIISKAKSDDNGPIKDRIQRHPKYQERLRAVGPRKVLEEERGAIQFELDYSRRHPDPVDRTSQREWEDKLIGRLEAIKAELGAR